MSEKRLLIVDENGFISESYDKNVEKELKKNNAHICSECTRLTSGNCPKVKDSVKKEITGYKFITKGYQVLLATGEVTNFGVFNCTLYEQGANELAEILSKKIIDKANGSAYGELLSAKSARGRCIKNCGQIGRSFFK